MIEAATRPRAAAPIHLHVTMISSTHRLTVFAVILVTLGITGCVNDNNRTTTTAEVQAADVKRQSFIDSMPNLTPEQRAQMKAHMGGAPAATMGRGPGPSNTPTQATGNGSQPGNGPSGSYAPQPGNGPPKSIGAGTQAGN